MGDTLLTYLNMAWELLKTAWELLKTAWELLQAFQCMVVEVMLMVKQQIY